MNELKLYSPITADFVEDEPDEELDLGYMDIEDYAQHLDGRDLVYFQDIIEETIEDETLPEEAERGLMTWYVEEKNDRLYGVAVCEVRGELNPDELAELKEYCTGQYADGWGEGFEQRERKCADGELYVHFWRSDKFFICTEQEMERNRQRQKQRQAQKQRGGGAR